MKKLAEDRKKLRFGIVGCGAIGPTHAGAIQQIAGAELVAVADTKIERAQEVAAKFGVTKVYDSERALITDPEIDVVCMCTPSGMHADGAVAALEAGKHVIVEKPMEISLEACDRMIAAEDATGKKLAIISQHRFDAATLIVKEAIDNGKLGKIVLADATVKWWRTQNYYDSGDWRGTWAVDGGGALMNQGIHTVDLLQWLAGGVSSLFAYTRTAAHDRIEVEDIATATLTFENGAIGTLTATTAAYEGFPVRIDIYGTEGTAVLEGDRLKTLNIRPAKSSMVRPPPPTRCRSQVAGPPVSRTKPPSVWKATPLPIPGAVGAMPPGADRGLYPCYPHRRQTADRRTRGPSPGGDYPGRLPVVALRSAGDHFVRSAFLAP